MSFPLADLLPRRGVPFLFATGQDGKPRVRDIEIKAEPLLRAFGQRDMQSIADFLGLTLDGFDEYAEEYFSAHTSETDAHAEPPFRTVQPLGVHFA